MREGEQGFGQGELQYAADEGLQRVKNRARIQRVPNMVLLTIFFIKNDLQIFFLRKLKRLENMEVHFLVKVDTLGLRTQPFGITSF